MGFQPALSAARAAPANKHKPAATSPDVLFIPAPPDVRPGVYQAPALIQRAAFSAIINVGLFVLPLVMVGMMLASTMRSPRMPRKRRWESSGADASSGAPMRTVPTG